MTTIDRVITTPQEKPPKLLVDVEYGKQECAFCKVNTFIVMYLYTRKQIHVCWECDKILDAIMDTNNNHKRS